MKPKLHYSFKVKQCKLGFRVSKSSGGANTSNKYCAKFLFIYVRSSRNFVGERKIRQHGAREISVSQIDINGRKRKMGASYHS